LSNRRHEEGGLDGLFEFRLEDGVRRRESDDGGYKTMGGSRNADTWAFNVAVQISAYTIDVGALVPMHYSICTLIETDLYYTVVPYHNHRTSQEQIRRLGLFFPCSVHHLLLQPPGIPLPAHLFRDSLTRSLRPQRLSSKVRPYSSPSTIQGIHIL
jgi:hypothetical protein